MLPGRRDRPVLPHLLGRHIGDRTLVRIKSWWELLLGEIQSPLDRSIVIIPAQVVVAPSFPLMHFRLSWMHAIYGLTLRSIIASSTSLRGLSNRPNPLEKTTVDGATRVHRASAKTLSSPPDRPP